MSNIQDLFRGTIPLRLPLFLTIGRICVSPLFIVVYLRYKHLGISLYFLPFILLFFLMLSELSDFFDGYLARKNNTVTELGKLLDPMADSITHLTIFLAFTQGLIRLPLFLVFIFIYRDAMVSTLRTLCALRGVALAARISGKVKALLQGMAIFLVLILMIPYVWGYLPLAQFQDMSFYIITTAAMYTLFSGGEYIWMNRLYIKQAWGGGD